MSSTADNLAIKIPETHYVGFQKREGDQVPLGFMTPDGSDKAAMKRKATVDSWANGYGYSSRKQATIPSKTFDNKPMVGFKIAKLVAGGGRGWDARSDAWRIEDPRGFELEIGSGNFQEILAVSTIERGEILEECIWGRLGTNNILIPVTSDVYERAAANTERMGKKSSIREAKPGYHLIFQNGEEAMYMGKTYASGYSIERERINTNLAYEYDYAITREFKTFNDKPIHTYILYDKNGQLSRIMMRDSLKLSEVREGPELTLAEACDKINDLITLRKSVDIPNKYNAHRVTQFSPSLVSDLEENYKFSVEKIGKVEELKKLIISRQDEETYYNNTVFVEIPANSETGLATPEVGLGHIHWWDKSTPLTTRNIASNLPRRLDYSKLFDNCEVEKLLRTEEYQDRYWNNMLGTTKTRVVQDKIDLNNYKIDDLVFHKMIGTYSTFSGKTVRIDHTEEC